ncbi:MAG: hypothetical protein ABW199_05345 [Caulobacterales bacterium]
MRDNVTLNAEKCWSLASVEKLAELWKENVPAELIAQTLGRPTHEITSMATELKLRRPHHAPAD